jgi:hypothetical protein
MVLDYKEYESNKTGESKNESNLAAASSAKFHPSTPKAIFQFASDQMESLHEISLEIHEKYCSPQDD